eukprot:TRINITY_DN899_c0_g1_i10.p1 TRINITY_DN899_c0_g1~~TRINITY_DN899_c0_g1_i10.p1  ORF type:complete len:268 (-),score=48.12 TRINITY_DN899_c0_g1_i10:61-864(-)
MSGFRGFCRLLGVAGGTSTVVLLAAQNSKDGQFLKSRFLLNAETDAKVRRSAKWDYNWDARNPATNPSMDPPSNARRNIILIRHGQYNLEGQEDKDRYLTELGLQQAKITGERLAEMALPYTSIAVSGMKRAIQTANIVHETLPNVPLLPQDTILNEGDPIETEPRGSWYPDYEYYVDGARIEAAFRKYFHRAESAQTEDSYEIVVCHANVIRYFLCRALQLPPEAWLRFSLRHASITWLVIRPDGEVNCRGIGESGHFPVDKLSVT